MTITFPMLHFKIAQEILRQKLSYDLYYVKNASPWLDLQLLTATAWSLVREVSRFAWSFVDLPSAANVRQSVLPIGVAGEFADNSLNQVSVAASTMTVHTSA